MDFLFVMDPAQTMLPDRDTSFALMKAARARGHQCWHCQPHQLTLRGRNVFAEAQPISVSDTAPHLTLDAASELDLAGIDAVLIRKDPPFDKEYLQLTRQLELIVERTFIVNSPQGLRDANEKLFAFHFYEHMPTSMVASQPAKIRQFLRQVGGKAVLKPLDAAGGSGIVRLDADEPNERALIDLLTEEGKTHVLVQRYLPNVHEGDKRVLLLDGQVLGVVLRVPQGGDFRANIHVGGAVSKAELTPAETDIVRTVSPELVRRGLWFVGLDLVGGYLIEINVTSPTGIQELARLTGSEPEHRVLEWLEARVRTHATRA